ncbi:MAG: DUF4397 domain-containing protein [Chloroflexota bacterium]
MRVRIPVVILVIVTLFVGGLANLQTIQAEPVPTGFVRVIHVSPGTSNIDIYLDGAKTPSIANLGYGTSTGFIALPSATHIAVIRAAGSLPGADPLLVKSFILSPDSHLNLVAIGLLSRKGSRGFLVLQIPANFSPSDGLARVQLIHASPDAGPITMSFNGQTALESLLYGDGLFTGIDALAGSYNIAVATTQRTPPVVINLSNMGLAGNTLYTIVTVGLLKDIHPLILVDPLKIRVPKQ